MADKKAEALKNITEQLKDLGFEVKPVAAVNNEVTGKISVIVAATYADGRTDYVVIDEDDHDTVGPTAANYEQSGARVSVIPVEAILEIANGGTQDKAAFDTEIDTMKQLVNNATAAASRAESTAQSTAASVDSQIAALRSYVDTALAAAAQKGAQS